MIPGESSCEECFAVGWIFWGLWMAALWGTLGVQWALVLWRRKR